MNYYEILKVAPTATGEEIRVAYINLCKDLHPDKLGSLNENLRHLAEEQLKLVNLAYETLKDEQLRAQYDRELTHQQARNEQVEVNHPTTDPTLDELLSSAVLEEGFQIFAQEEEALWQSFIKELHRVREQHGIEESPHLSVNLFPDDLGMKLFRVFALIGSGIVGMGVVMIIFGLLAGVVAIALGFIINILLYPLGTLVFWFYLYIFLPFLVIVYFGIILYSLFTDDNVTDEECRQREKSQCIFSQSIHRYWKQTEELGANFRAYKIFSTLYPSDYVEQVTNKRNKFSERIKELISKRHEKVNFFKELNPDKLTGEYVSSLSACERLLLMKALQQKAEEAQQQANNAELANVLKAAGAVVLLGILFGGGGGF